MGVSQRFLILSGRRTSSILSGPLHISGVHGKTPICRAVGGGGFSDELAPTILKHAHLHFCKDSPRLSFGTRTGAFTKRDGLLKREEIGEEIIATA